MEYSASATVLHFSHSAQLQMEYSASATVLSFSHSAPLQPQCSTSATVLHFSHSAQLQMEYSASVRVLKFKVLRKVSRRRLCFHEALLQLRKDLLEQIYKITPVHMIHILQLWIKFWSSSRKVSGLNSDIKLSDYRDSSCVFRWVD